MTPVPVENGIPAACCVIRDQQGWRTAWLIDRRKVPFGSPFRDARSAARESMKINREIELVGLL